MLCLKYLESAINRGLIEDVVIAKGDLTEDSLQKVLGEEVAESTEIICSEKLKEVLKKELFTNLSDKSAGEWMNSPLVSYTTAFCQTVFTGHSSKTRIC